VESRGRSERHFTVGERKSALLIPEDNTAKGISMFVPHRKRSVFYTETNRSMLFREVAAVSCENHTEQTKRPERYLWKIGFFNVKASRHGHFFPWERNRGTHWIGGWVGPRPGLLPPPVMEPEPVTRLTELPRLVWLF
jgi:hypothetical protein